jgi:hypothetical protein
MKNSTILLNAAALVQLSAAQSYTLQTQYGTGMDFFDGFSFFTVSPSILPVLPRLPPPFLFLQKRRRRRRRGRGVKDKNHSHHLLTQRDWLLIKTFPI